jgi:hypothetical protein
MKKFIQNWQNFHAGKLSRKEAIEFIRFLDSENGKIKFQKLLERIWTEQIEKPDGNELVKEQETPPKSAHKTVKKNRGNFLKIVSDFKKTTIQSYFRYAACLMAIFLLMKSRDYLPGFSADEANDSPKIEWISKVNPKGIKSRFLLPDSTLVVLNAGSQLQYSNNFIENRYVFLEGEAFFDVTEDKNNPFVVETSTVTTKVLGTSFNINSYDPESFEVGLVTGALKISNELTGKELFLLPGEGSKIVSGTDKLDKFPVDPTEIGQWKEGILRFNNEPFEKVIEKLENWYGVEITVTGKLPEKTCTGTFQKNTYLSNVLKSLGHALKFSSKINKNQVTIKTASKI